MFLPPKQMIFEITLGSVDPSGKVTPEIDRPDWTLRPLRATVPQQGTTNKKSGQ
jgi:hypothetical protein